MGQGAGDAVIQTTAFLALCEIAESLTEERWSRQFGLRGKARPLAWWRSAVGRSASQSGHVPRNAAGIEEVDAIANE